MKEREKSKSKFCKECREREGVPRESSIYKVYSEPIMIKLPETYNKWGDFEYYQIEKQLEVFICSNKHIWCELNSP